MDINQVEDLNGLRFSFNVLPTNRLDAAACSFPIGCLYTPLKIIQGHQPFQYDPISCQKCNSFLNPYCAIDLTNKTWKCPICESINVFPSTYHEMTQECLAAELLPEFTTIEYMKKFPSYPPIFLFVVDTCVSSSEMESLKAVLLQTIDYIPNSALVGFITYGTLIYLHELRFTEYSHNYVFNGLKTYSDDQIKKYLSIKMINGIIQNDVIIPKSEAEQMLTSIVDNLCPDPFFVEKGNRPNRCTGAALDLAVTLFETIYRNKASSQIFLFSGGPITKGPGKMAELSRDSKIRQHQDIENGSATMSQQSRAFFAKVAKKASNCNVVINLISASFEESGVYEIMPAVYDTGGFLLSNESFSENNVSKTFLKYFKGGIIKNVGVNCQMYIRLSKLLKVSGCIGPCNSAETMSAYVSPNKIGCGGTSQWKMVGLLPQTTFAFYFDILNSKVDPILLNSIAYIQFVTRYRHLSSGTIRIRVTTAALRFADLEVNKNMIMQGFDQEAASILLSKQIMFTVYQKDEAIDIIHIIDNKLISLCKRFGEYTVNEPGSFKLPYMFEFIPQFIYHLRRSPFLNKFNSSPDQTAALRHTLLCQDVNNSMFMIQPALLKYSLDQPPTPVLLDTSSLKHDCVLLFDSYYRVLIWHGSSIAAWRDMRYQDQEEYQNLKAALEQPRIEAMELLKERFPTPQFISCDQNSSLERYLLARCNPSGEVLVLVPVASDGGFTSEHRREGVSTDEQSMYLFIKKLKEMATSQ